MHIDTVNIYFKGAEPAKFLQDIGARLSSIGLQVSFAADRYAVWSESSEHKAYSIFEDRLATHARSASATRLLNTDYWLFEGMHNENLFQPDKMPEGAANSFFDDLAAQTICPFEYPFGMEDFVLVVLGDDEPRNLASRPFSNSEVIKLALEFEPHRQIVVYSEVDTDMPTLIQSGRVTFSKAKIDRLLDSCAFVVSQDSQITLRALLHRKHSIQMAACGFHHISRNPTRDQRIKKSFNRIHRDKPEYEKYIKWLFKSAAIDSVRLDAMDLVISRIQTLEW